MDNSPLVSVILPNYNHARFLEQRIKSILAQTYRNFEIIILDDCSTDNSREVIEKHSSGEKVSHAIFNQVNSGSTFSQWKKGIQLASGNYVWIAESDDFCDPDFLSTGMNKLNQGFDLFYCRSIDVNEDGVPLEKNNNWLDDISTTRWKSDFSNSSVEEVRDMLFIKNTIPNASAVLFKKEEWINTYLDQITGMKYCGDWLFWMNYLLHSKQIYYSAGTSNYFRIHATTSRRSQSKELRNEEVATVIRFILHHPLSKGKRKAIVNYFFRHHFFKKWKRDFRWNMKAAFRQSFISFRFISCWLAYYFKG